MYGIKISKTGLSAQTDDKSSLLLDTESNLLKVKQSGRITLANTAKATIPHKLGYIPIYWVFVKRTNNLETIYYPLADTYAYTNKTNLIIYNGDGASRDFYYYIFYDEV